MENIEIHRFEGNKVLWYTDYDLKEGESASAYLAGNGYTRKGGLWVRAIGENGKMIAVVRSRNADKGAAKRLVR